MNSLPPLEFGGVSHWTALAVLLVAGLCIVELGQSYKKSVRNRTAFWAGAVFSPSVTVEGVVPRGTAAAARIAASAAWLLDVDDASLG